MQGISPDSSMSRGIELVVAILFIIALSLFVAALVWFGRETGISVSSADFL
jgi:hypothetical protein